MKSLQTFAVASSFLMLPIVAGAQSVGFTGDGGLFGDLLGNIIDFINGVLIPFILGIGFLVFVWGMFRYFIAGAADEEKRNNGKNLMIYATLAFVLIIIFWGIVNLITGSLGEWANDTLNYEPTAPGPSGGGGGGGGGGVDATP